MLNLTTTSDVLRVITTAAVTTDVHATFVDLVTATEAVTPGRTNTAIGTATTTTVVAAPASGSVRNVKLLTVRNTHAANAQTVTIAHYDGTTAVELWEGALAAGESVVYTDERGFVALSSTGAPKSVQATSAPAINAVNIVVLGGDVVNNNAVANTIADVTGLSFPVTAGETYWYEFIIPYTAAATTTGSRWAINGPAAPTMLNHRSEYTLTATSVTTNSATAYDIPAASNATSLTVGNVATMWGVITPSASGTVIARFASEVLSSAITAKAGATLRWMRVR